MSEHDDYDSAEEEDFLAELDNDRYVAAPVRSDKEIERARKDEVREAKRVALEHEREMKRQVREAKRDEREREAEARREAKRAKKSGGGDADAGDDQLFSEAGTPIQGKDKIVLLKKVKQYKSLFPAELKGFKVKKNPSTKELADALSEMEVLVETSGVDGFLMDGVFQTMKLVEGASSCTKNYDIRGCADLLKANKEFHNLCKQMFIKYGVFSSVPAEYQLLLLVSTTAYVCAGKNKNKGAMNDYLNATI